MKMVTDSGIRCIEKHYYQLGLPLPKNYTPRTPVPKNYRPQSRFTTREINVTDDSLEKRQLSCKPYALVWARGTGEPASNGGMGSMMGKQLLQRLNSAQPGKWNGVGVKYNNGMAGIYCVGLPGGVSCVQEITRLNARCPQTRYIVGGFSQGAMVAHNCAAFAPENVKKKIAGVVVAGDPMDGAPIKGIPKSKIKTFCVANDGVCGGVLAPSAGHGAYAGAKYINEAKTWILRNI